MYVYICPTLFPVAHFSIAILALWFFKEILAFMALCSLFLLLPGNALAINIHRSHLPYLLQVLIQILL